MEEHKSLQAMLLASAQELADVGNFALSNTLICAAAAIEALASALRALRDTQNGPPLLQYEAEWREGMEAADDMLTTYEER